MVTVMEALYEKNRYLKNKNGHQIKIDRNKAAAIKQTLAEPNSIRATARIHNCCVKTVKRARDGVYDNED